jgi:hypothetical protein
LTQAGSGSGFPGAIFEVGNEIDGAQQDNNNLWFVPVATGQADCRRLSAYNVLYQAWSNVITQAANEHPEKKIQLVGPAFSGTFYYGSCGNWFEQFVDQAAQNHWRLDAVSFHQYDDLVDGYGTPIADSSYPARIAGIQQHLMSGGLGSTRVWVTEFGPDSSWGDVSGFSADHQPGLLNYTNLGAAWMADFIRKSVPLGITAGCYLQVRDNQGGDGTGTVQGASYDHTDNGMDYPKPPQHVAHMIHDMTGTRRALTFRDGVSKDLDGIASGDSGSVALLVYNHNFHYDWAGHDYHDQSTSQTFSVAFTGLPFEGTVTVEHLLVDASHSNIGQGYLLTGTLNLGGSTLYADPPATAKVVEGSILLDDVTLGPSGVTMWIVHP